MVPHQVLVRHRFREGEARRAGISPAPNFKPNGDPDFAKAAAAQQGRRAEAFRANEARRAGISPAPNLKSNGKGAGTFGPPGRNYFPGAGTGSSGPPGRNYGAKTFKPQAGSLQSGGRGRGVQKPNGGGNKTSTATGPFNITTVGGRDAERSFPTANRTANRQGPHKGNPNTRSFTPNRLGGATEASNVVSRAKKFSHRGDKTFPVQPQESFIGKKLHPVGSPNVLPTNRGVMKPNSGTAGTVKSPSGIYVSIPGENWAVGPVSDPKKALTNSAGDKYQIYSIVPNKKP